MHLTNILNEVCYFYFIYVTVFLFLCSLAVEVSSFYVESHIELAEKRMGQVNMYLCILCSEIKKHVKPTVMKSDLSTLLK